MSWQNCIKIVVFGFAIPMSGAAQAEPPVTVPVGNGAVAYEYQIGKFEVTNEEYCEFLNAVLAGHGDPELCPVRQGLRVKIGALRLVAHRRWTTSSSPTDRHTEPC